MVRSVADCVRRTSSVPPPPRGRDTRGLPRLSSDRDPRDPRAGRAPRDRLTRGVPLPEETPASGVLDPRAAWLLLRGLLLPFSLRSAGEGRPGAVWDLCEEGEEEEEEGAKSHERGLTAVFCAGAFLAGTPLNLGLPLPGLVGPALPRC